MAIHNILRMGDPRLFQVAAPVSRFDTRELHDLVRDLFDTMRAAGGCGLAAPQIGVSLQVVVFGVDSARAAGQCPTIPDTVLINPHIEPLGTGTDIDWEACLSVPGLRGRVRRPNRIRYRAWRPDGQLLEHEVAGFHARVIQHECDHLQGVLYPSRIEDWQSFGFSDAFDAASEPDNRTEVPASGRS